MSTWTKQQACDFMVNYHFINSTPATSIVEVFSRIQSIQYDPLNVVGTNSELVLQSRIKTFRKQDLYNALYQHRILVDGWDKQMGIYQAKDYPLFQPVRAARAYSEAVSLKKYLQLDISDYVQEVLSIFEAQGPLFSKDIKLGESTTNKWGRTKPSSATIDYLFHKGDLGIVRRNNTQKQYDLVHRLLPNCNDPLPFTNEEDFIDYYILRRIKSMGLIWNKNGVHFSGIHIYNTKTRNKHLQRLLDQNKITKIHIEGIKDPFFVPTEALNIPVSIKQEISFIAPIDNLIWDRKLMQTLYDFDYSWEVYTPAAKRKYGYYVLPILLGSRFIGRIEFEQQRNSNPLVVKEVWLEPHVKYTKTLHKTLYKAFHKFANYLEAEDVLYENNRYISW